MKLHAGNLYKNYLILRGEDKDYIIIQVPDSE
jgi:hypothetical protein